ncbi:MAG: hypothetical protein ABL893_21000, partial [Hyphomicrobium sp.]
MATQAEEPPAKPKYPNKLTWREQLTIVIGLVLLFAYVSHDAGSDRPVSMMVVEGDTFACGDYGKWRSLNRLLTAAIANNNAKGIEIAKTKILAALDANECVSLKGGETFPPYPTTLQRDGAVLIKWHSVQSSDNKLLTDRLWASADLVRASTDHVLAAGGSSSASDANSAPDGPIPQQKHPILDCRKLPDKNECVKASWKEFKSAILSEYANWKKFEGVAEAGDPNEVSRAIASAIGNGWYVHNHWHPIAPQIDEFEIVPFEAAETIHWCRVAIIDMKFWLVGLTGDYAANET